MPARIAAARRSRSGCALCGHRALPAASGRLAVRAWWVTAVHDDRRDPTLGPRPTQTSRSTGPRLRGPRRPPMVADTAWKIRGRGIRSEGSRPSSQPFRAASRRCPGRAILARCRRTGTCVVRARHAHRRSASAPTRSTSRAVHATSASPEPKGSTGLPRDRAIPVPETTVVPQTVSHRRPAGNARHDPRMVLLSAAT